MNKTKFFSRSILILNCAVILSLLFPPFNIPIVEANESIVEANENNICYAADHNGSIQTFTDVPTSHWAWRFIEHLFVSEITGGCAINPLRYCPENYVTRAEMAVFLVRIIHGSAFQPPAVGNNTGFIDVPTTHWAAAWIKQLALDGITTGCGGGNYCPDEMVTRAEMAVFLLRTEYGAAYTPPPVGSTTGFNDVPTSHWAASWIKQLAADGITTGCGTNLYCPQGAVTRAEMAVFLIRAFIDQTTAEISDPLTSGDDGKVVFYLPEGGIEVEVIDENWVMPIANVQLQVIDNGLIKYVLMVDPQGFYYPEIKEIRLSSLSPLSAIDPETGEAITIIGAITIAAVTVIAGHSIYEYLSDIPDFEYGFGWVEYCMTMDQFVNTIDLAVLPFAIIKIKEMAVTKTFSIFLKEGGQAVGFEIAKHLLNAVWCENQWPHPFRIKQTALSATILPLFIIENFPLGGCGVQVSTCPPNSGHLYGKVTDAVTGRPLDFVSITLPYRPFITALTNFNGDYSKYQAPAGYSTVQAQLEGYSPESKVVYIPDGGEAELNFSLSPVTDIHQIRAVLTWGETPQDLDAHLWLPANNPYHIYYLNKGNIDAFPWAELDRDDTDSYGPETITLRIDKVSGLYTLAIHQYSSSGDIARSNATVTIYRGSDTLRTFKVSNAQGSGRWWYIADFEPQRNVLGGWNINIYSVNRLQTAPPR